MDIPSDATCSNDQIQCKNPAGQLWPADFPQGDQSHCFDCQLTCPSQNITLPTEGEWLSIVSLCFTFVACSCSPLFEPLHCIEVISLDCFLSAALVLSAAH